MQPLTAARDRGARRGAAHARRFQATREPRTGVAVTAGGTAIPQPGAGRFSRSAPLRPTPATLTREHTPIAIQRQWKPACHEAAIRKYQQPR